MWRLLFTLCVLVLCYKSVQAECFGPIYVDDGQGPTYIMANKSNGVNVGSTQLQNKHGKRVYYTQKCQQLFDPTVFKPFYVLDKTLSFKTDVSSISCGCNAAFILVSMPAYNQNQQPDPTNCNDYYCDANDVCGVWCPEMDLMEANRAAFAVTPHICDKPQGKWFPHCDTSGCSLNTKNMGNSYGLGSSYTINTQFPFNVSFNFQTSGGVLSKIVTTFSQDNGQFTITHDDERCGGGYLSSMTSAFKQGMVLVTSYWSGATGGDMGWLDIPPCNANENCDTHGVVSFTNLALK